MQSDRKTEKLINKRDTHTNKDKQTDMHGARATARALIRNS